MNIHQCKLFPKYVEPQYYKKVTEELSISLTYLPGNTECLLSFHNTLDQSLIVNKTSKKTPPKESGGWFENVFRITQDDANEPLQTETGDDANPPLSLFLGYIQLLGYVVLNYKFDFNDSSFIELGNKYFQWWSEKDYADRYLNEDIKDVVVNPTTTPGTRRASEQSNGSTLPSNELNSRLSLASNQLSSYTYSDSNSNQQQTNDDDDGSLDEKLDRVPFIKLSMKDRMVIGGKVGGLNDLIIEKEEGNHSNNRQTTSSPRQLLQKLYLLRDLVFGFNSSQFPTIKNADEDINISAISELISNLTKAILPFYATSQSLLFTDVTLFPQETKTYHLSLPELKYTPPSYNHRLTGLTGDQGLVSIRYLLVIGLLEMQETGNLENKSIYFPYEVNTNPEGNQHALPDFLQKTSINYKWKVDIKSENYLKSDKGKKNESKSKENDDSNGQSGSLETALDSIGGNESTTYFGLNICIPNNHSMDTKASFMQDLRELIDADLYNIPRTSTSERKGSVSSQSDLISSKGSFIPQVSGNNKSQYQISVNQSLLCTIKISKPYFRVGDDINFVLELNNGRKVSKRIVGVITQLEATEKYNYTKISSKGFTTPHQVEYLYKVSPSIKKNLFAPAMINSETTNVYGVVNIPNHLTPQFQSSRLLQLSYSLVFKFNLLEFDVEDENSQVPTETPENPSVETFQPNEEMLIHKSTEKDEAPYDKYKKYQGNNEGNEFSFRIPIVIV